MALGMSSYEKFFRKFFFQKVHFMLNIFIYYDIFISLILLKLSYIENTYQTLILSPKSLENITFRVSGKDSKFLKCSGSVGIHCKDEQFLECFPLVSMQVAASFLEHFANTNKDKIKKSKALNIISFLLIKQ